MYGYIEKGSTGVPPSVPFELPKNLFRYGEQTMWSSQMLTNGAANANSSLRLFSTPLGQVGQGFTNAMTIGETNIKEGGRIPSGIAYDVYGVACIVSLMIGAGDTNVGFPINDAVSANTVRFLQQVTTNGILSWDFTQTQVDIAPIVLIGAGGGSFGSIAISDIGNAGAPTNRGGTMNNGAGSVFLYRKHPVALPGNSTFSILLRFGSRMGVTPAESAVVKVVLLGYYKNVIEIG